jgi:transposase
MSLTVPVEVPPRDREVLASWTRSPSMPAGLVQRARIVLLAADGVGTNEIVRRVGVSKPTVISWKRRYAAGGVGGLEDRPKPGRPRTVDEAAVVAATLEPPPDRLGVTHWSTRLLAAELGISNFAVGQVWKKWGLQPWRSETFKFSTDPELEAKVRDVRRTAATAQVWCRDGRSTSTAPIRTEDRPRDPPLPQALHCPTPLPDQRGRPVGDVVVLELAERALRHAEPGPPAEFRRRSRLARVVRRQPPLVEPVGVVLRTSLRLSVGP